MELAWILTATFGLIILYLMYWLKRSNRDYWVTKGVPYFDSLPLLGVLKDTILMKRGMFEIINDIYWKYQGQKFVGFYQLTKPWIMIRDPELVNQVLIKDFTYFEDRGPKMRNPRDVLTNAYPNLSGDDWRLVRHKLTPTFTSGRMKMMFKAMKDCSEDLVVYLSDKTDQDLESRSIMSKYVLNVIGNIAFGLKIDTFDENEEKNKNFFKYSTLFFKPSLSLLLKFMISQAAPVLKDLFRFKLTDEGVDTFFSNLTKDIIKYREGTDTKRNDFLQLMLDLKNKEKETLKSGVNTAGLNFQENEPIESEDKELLDQLKNMPVESKTSLKTVEFTDQFIAAQIFLFISAGSETAAAILTFILFELAQHQDLQKKVQEEIQTVTSEKEINYDSVKKLVYMEQFINETLRAHPIVPNLIRICTKDYKIPGTNIIIEKGNFVNIPLVGLQQDPQYFSEPQKFDPDRFQDMDAIPKGVFLPFGGGPRICIAMRLAMLEMKVCLATLLANYTVTLSKKTNVPLKLLKNSIFASVEGGVWIKFHKRQ